MVAEKSKQTEGDLVPIALRIPADMNDELEHLAQFVRGGKSELIRRCVVSGLPVVKVQRGIHIPKGGSNK